MLRIRLRGKGNSQSSDLIMNTLVKIVVPFYKDSLEEWEQAALSNNLEVLSSWPVCFVKPEGLDLHAIEAAYPQAEVLEVSPDWLGRRRGIVGYNEMMMSKGFYELFSECEYILICHTDAWLFRDELKDWCCRGYDLVAAPWPVRPRYQHFPLKQFVWFKKRLYGWNGKLSRVLMYGRIGNGGLCLRRIKAFVHACERYADDISYFNSQTDSMHNEDIFWAIIPEDFHYPDVGTALRFAYDLKPRLCHKLNGQRLPMGCHGFMHKSRKAFWEQHIPGIKGMAS